MQAKSLIIMSSRISQVWVANNVFLAIKSKCHLRSKHVASIYCSKNKTWMENHDSLIQIQIGEWVIMP